MAQVDIRAILQRLDLVVQLDGEDLSATIALDRLVDPEGGTDARLSLRIPAKLTRRGHEQRLVYLPKQGAPSRRDPILVQLLVSAHATRRRIIEGLIRGQGAQTSQERRHQMRLARLSYLAPDIVQAILDGMQPDQLTARRMLREPRIPLGWAEQRRLFGFT
jgi:hypothetical protein